MAFARFSYDPSLLKIDGTSDLQLRLTYFQENGQTVWDVSEILVGDDKNNDNSFGFPVKSNRPEELRMLTAAAKASLWAGTPNP